MNFFRQRKECVTNDAHQLESQCGFNVNFPNRFLKRFFNVEYVSKKTKNWIFF